METYSLDAKIESEREKFKSIVSNHQNCNAFNLFSVIILGEPNGYEYDATTRTHHQLYSRVRAEEEREREMENY